MQTLCDAFAKSGAADRLKQSRYLSGVNERVMPLLVSALTPPDSMKLVITYDEKRGREIAADLKFYDRRTCFFPARDALFYSADIHSNTSARERFDVIKRISEHETATVVVTVDGLMEKLPKLSNITDSMLSLKPGDELDVDRFAKRMTEIGYERTTMVEQPGQFSVRGSIIDIYPLTEECPVRFELFGDDIESIRSFDLDSQRSIEQLENCEIYPASEMVLSASRIDRGIAAIEKEFKEREAYFKKDMKTEQRARLRHSVEDLKERVLEFDSTMGLDSYVEFFYDDCVTLLEYFPEGTSIYIDEPEKVALRAHDYDDEFKLSMEGRLEGGYVLPTQTKALLSAKEALKRIRELKPVLMSEFSLRLDDWGEKKPAEVNVRRQESYRNSFEALMGDILRWKQKGVKTLILSPSATRGKRIAKNLRDNDIEAHYSEDRQHILKPGEVMVSLGRLSGGFFMEEAGISVVCEGDIFTSREIKNKKRYGGGERIESFADISEGDYVVHERHGVGIYRGLDKVETDGRKRDYITIEYAGGSKLFVPVERLEVIGKLSGKDGAKRKLNKLGGTEWQRTRNTVKSKIDNIAKELVELYALRQVKQGFAYSPDTPWQREFEELFPYEETADQVRAIEDTKKDMESGKIMDRLICGDVGFGKTEVSIRAAFKAVQDNRQVAYLVPTTILCEQHYNTFKERMKDFPVNISMLSRFATAKDIKQTIEDLKSGKCDIVIGTHRLLSKDVEFKRLGLLIIDEEQRFGVKHKEQIKQLKNNVDVLTLTATPIPRTLHMSLVGLRDISLLDEPPVDRLPIQTYVMEYDEEFVKEAINRELKRKGQVYYVYNRVDNIEDITINLRSLVPHAVIEFAHGQMNERELESVMRRFISGEIDVLVSTTIIETGLDIPNVNTMIIHDSDRYGLAQLYQLRGRVGRSSRSAYAFLMYRKDKLLKEVAEKRLKAIREFTDLGSGYKISMRDLEIRGAGNLLGKEQSGNVEAVGYDMYVRLLSDAIKRLSGEKTEERDFLTTVDLPVDAYIPETYVKNEFVKLDLYKRISRLNDREESDDILEEVRDRFGEPPREFMRLIDVACIKAKAHSAYITDIKYFNGELKVYIADGAPVNMERLGKLLKRSKGRLKVFTEKQSGVKMAAAKTVQEELIHTADAMVDELSTVLDSSV